MVNRRRTPSELFAGCGRYALNRYRGNGDVYRHARAVEQNFSRPAEELLAEQDRAIAAIVDHAFHNSPFYRRCYSAAGFKPGDVKGRADLARLPEISKLDLVNNMDEILTAPKDQLHSTMTGGTTGVSLRFYRDTRCLRFRRALDLATVRYFGWRDGQWQGWLWGAPRDLVEPSGLRAKALQYFGDRVFFLDALQLSTENYRRFAQQVRRYRPTYVSAYPSLAYDFALRIEAGEIEPVRTPVVSLTAEPLYDFQREKIQQHFGDRVFERYGARETGMAALECPEHTGMHYFTESVYYEAIDRGPGVPGRSLVATDLLNYGMPLIRYQTGDFAEIENSPCSCGRSTPRLRNIKGRETDIVWRRDGRGVAGFVLTTLHAGLGIATPLQVVQESAERIVIRVEAKPGEWGAHLQGLTDIYRRELGDDIRYDVEYVDAIERAPSGKYRYVISHVTRPDGRI